MRHTVSRASDAPWYAGPGPRKRSSGKTSLVPQEVPMSGTTTRGVLFVHSTPAALCPHVEWAAGSVLDTRTTLEWTPQPAEAGAVRAELSWQAAQGTGARLASALRGWSHLRYDVTEEPSPGADGSRCSHTPSLGIHHTPIGVHGDALVGEARLRSAVAASGGDPRLLLQ